MWYGSYNRLGFPKDLVTKASKDIRGHSEYLSNGPLLACVWVDKRCVYFVDTVYVAEYSVRVKRRDTDGSCIFVQCPPLLPDYQAYMRCRSGRSTAEILQHW